MHILTKFMNMIGLVVVALFVIGWAAGVASWFYCAYHLLRWFLRRGRDSAHGLKAIKGGALFIGCGLFTAFNGLIGVWFGGWQVASH